MDCIDNNRNESKTVQNGDCDYLKKMAIPVICGEFFLNITKFYIMSVTWKFVFIFLY